MNATPMNPEYAAAAIDDYRKNGDPVAVTFRVWNAFNNDYEMRTVHGRKAHANPYAGTLSVYGGENGATWTRHYPLADVLAVGAVSPGDVVRTLKRGDRVYVRKYGSDYAGHVVETLKTRVRVRFTLASGKSREVTVNALDLLPSWGARLSAR